MSYLYQTPIEMPRGSHYGSDYWIAYSYKLKRKVHFFSMLEYANFVTLEMNPEVEFFCEQPLKITNSDSHLKKSSVFDFWVYYKNGESEFQEVKYSSELSGNSDSALRSQNQIEFQRKWCSDNGFAYKIVTEKELYVGQFTFPNLQLLQGHLLRYNLNNRIDTTKFYNILSQNGQLTLGDIKALEMFPLNFEMGFLAYQYYMGYIDMTINDRPLDNSTGVRLCE